MSEAYDFRDELQVAKRARAAVPNLGLTWIATLAAKTHPYAIEYIEQAPVLVLAANFGKPLRSARPDHMQYIAMRFRRIEGMKLRDAMAEFHVPFALRKLKSISIAPANTETVWAMRGVDPSVLSQAIPDKPKAQADWLKSLRTARARGERFVNFSPEVVSWLVQSIGAEYSDGKKPTHMPSRAADVADMISRGRFNPVWTFREAETAHGIWSLELNKQKNSESFVKQFGITLDTPIDYSPLPNGPTFCGEFLFSPLRTGNDLFVEGAAMHHCVASYVREVLSGKSRIFSVMCAGERLATVELAGSKPFAVKQLKGVCNAQVPIGVAQAVDKFRKSIQ